MQDQLRIALTFSVVLILSLYCTVLRMRSLTSSVIKITTLWFLPIFRNRPTACIRLSLVIFEFKVRTAAILASILTSAPRVLYSSKITKVSLSGIEVLRSMNSWLESLYTFQMLSEQNRMPLNFRVGLNWRYLEIHGTMWSFSGLLARTAPASIILATVYYFGNSNMVIRNLSHRDSPPPLTSLTSTTFSISISNILPSVPIISILSDPTSSTYDGNSLQLSFVPENPKHILTLAWSQEDDVIDSLNWVMSLKYTQLRNQ